jgi:SIR2-like domain
MPYCDQCGEAVDAAAVACLKCGEAQPAGERQPAGEPLIPYDLIADCFRNRTVIPFLGAAASFVGAPRDSALPDGKAFARHLARKSRYPGSESDPLTKIAQFLEENAGDRRLLLDEIHTIFCHALRPSYRSAITDFLRRLAETAMPRLILTTNFDILVERTMQSLGIPYLAISHVMTGDKWGRFLCYESLETSSENGSATTLKKLEARLQRIEEDNQRIVLIYKMHGTSLRFRGAGFDPDSIVLTEQDYIKFLAHPDLLKIIPPKIVDILSTGRLLFLGYALEDWNFRVLMYRLQELQGGKNEERRRHWACLLDADQVEVKFWERRNVNLYLHSLDKFLAGLGQAIAGRAA